MCFGTFSRHWIREMSRWGRKKYEISGNDSRRASSFVLGHRNGGQSSDTGRTTILGQNLNSTLLSSPELVPPPRPNPRNRRSHSLTNLSAEPISSPPPLPPRRRVPPPPSRHTFLGTNGGDGSGIQLPPPSMIPVFERNAAMARNSRLVLDHPFVYFRFDSGPSANIGRVPLWIEDEPPSYEEALKMQPIKLEPVVQTNQAEEHSVIQVEPEEIVVLEENDEGSKPKEVIPFRKETSV